MKTLLTALVLLFAVVMSSCSNSSVTGPGGTGNVTLTTTLQQDQQGAYYFVFAPSTSVTVTTVTASCPQLQLVNSVFTGDGTTVYTAMSPFNIPGQGLLSVV